MNNVKIKNFLNKIVSNLTKKTIFLIFLLTIFFLCLFVYSLNTIKKEMVYLAKENQERIVSETKSKVFNWISFTRKNLEGSAEFISKTNLLEEEDNALLYLNEIKTNIVDFDLVQLMLEDGKILNNNGYSGHISDFDLSQMSDIRWYKNVKTNPRTITATVNHVLLKEQTMNICSPIIKNEIFMGLLCGVIKSSTMIEKIRRLSIPENIYFFIVMKDGQIIINHEDSNKIKNEIQEIINSKKHLASHEAIKYESSDELINIFPLGIFDWSVGVGVNKEGITKSTDILFWQGIAILIAFFILIITANTIHEFFYNRLNKNFKRIQNLVDLWIKDSSRGFIIVEKNKNITFRNTKADEYINTINSFNKKIHDKMMKALKEQEKTKSVAEVNNSFFEICTYPIYLNENYEGMIVLIKDITKDIELEQSRKEHEYLFMHQEKMVEIGELIVGINHQLKQPINGLSILMSNLLQQHNNNTLDDTTFKTNMHLCQKNLTIMNNIIDLYRKYYKNTFEIVNFNIKDCVTSVKDILDTKIKRNNIQIHIDVENDLSAYTMENVIQQVILVLLQNAIDENISSKNKNITIKAIDKGEKIAIQIIDNGSGVDDRIIKKLFKNPLKTLKKDGTGFGLYFANKLINKKIGGDIKVESCKNPTIFTLEFAKIFVEKVNSELKL